MFLSICGLTDLKSQITPPYSTGFETNDPLWKHYGQNKIDDWQRGKGYSSFSAPLSGNFAWCTNIDGAISQGTYYLESPAFNLSDTLKTYVISFYNKSDFSDCDYFGAGCGYAYIEYSIDNGTNWLALVISDDKKTENWGILKYGTIRFVNKIQNYQRSRASLKHVQGNTNIKFRFGIYNDATYKYSGWIVDNFEIFTLEKPDIIARTGNTITGLPSNMPSYDILLNYTLVEELKTFNDTLFVYQSSDSLLDISDPLIEKKAVTLNIGLNNIRYNVANNGNIKAGKNYFFYKFDTNNKIDEIDENNNINYAIIDAEPVVEVPYTNDFETPNNDIKIYQTPGGNNAVNTMCEKSWMIGNANDSIAVWDNEGIYNYSQIFSSPYFKNNSIYSYRDQADNCLKHFQSPNFNVSGDNIVHMFYHASTYPGVYYQNAYLSPPNNLNWTSSSQELIGYGSDYDSPVVIQNLYEYQKTMNANFSSTTKMPFKFRLSQYSNGWDDFAQIDDIYFGPKKPDIKLSAKNVTRYSILGKTTDTLFYNYQTYVELPTAACKTKFYYSLDSVFDSSDILLGQNNEPPMDTLANERRYFVYTKPDPSLNKYYFIIQADAENTIDEIREYNNQSIIEVKQGNVFSLPYFNNFENNIDGWRHYSDYKVDPWYWGTPTIKYPDITGKAICSNTTILNNDTRSYLLSPIFDFSGVSNPVLEFDMTYVDKTMLNHIFAIPYFQIRYSTDGGATWSLLDTTNLSFKRWYTINNTSDRYWQFVYNSQDTTINSRKWNNSILDLSFLKNKKNVQFRFHFEVKSKFSETSVSIDNFSIKQKYVDLTIDSLENLYLSPQSKNLKLGFYIRNLGNYLSDSTTINFYLSADSVLDANDPLIGQNIVLARVQPDQRLYTLAQFDSLGNSLAGKNYLFFKIDNNNTINESNESNNICFYRLNPAGIKAFPYVNDFSDIVRNGWRSYCGHPYYAAKNRFIDNLKDGNLKLVLLQHWESPKSFAYIETPHFDFSTLAKVHLSFELNSFSKGVNIEYSSDGGQSWKVLGTSNDSLSTNWYDSPQILDLNNEPGWTPNFPITVTYNASTLFAGKPDIMFRIKTFTIEGIGTSEISTTKIDNFRVGETPPQVDFVALNKGDNLTFTASKTDTIKFIVRSSSTGNITGSCKVDFMWSTDSTTITNSTAAGSATISNLSPNNTDTLDAIISYPVHSCKSDLYLVYRINPEQQSKNSGLFYPLKETDYSNNIGYFNVHLNNHNEVLPTTLLNVVNDTILCKGSTLVLEPSRYTNADNITWNTLSTSKQFLVSDSGTYWANIVSYYGCKSTTNSIRVDFHFNDVNLKLKGTTNVCNGDSVALYIQESGTPTWSFTSSTDSLVYAFAAQKCKVTLTSPKGCISTDSVLLTTDFPLKPVISETGKKIFCEQGSTLEVLNGHKFNSYLWNNGDTTRVMGFNTNGLYYVSTKNACGTQNSDTLDATFYKTLDSISPSSKIKACLNDTIPLEVHLNAPATSITWYENNFTIGARSVIYNPQFTTASTNTSAPSITWRVESPDPDVLTKYSSSDSRYLLVNPTGKPIYFITDIVNTSNYVDIRLKVEALNKLADSIVVYYIKDGGIKTKFDTNAVMLQNTSKYQIATHYLDKAYSMQIIVEFNGTSLPGVNNNQILLPVLISGVKKLESYNRGTGKTYNHILTEDKNMLVIINNGKCLEKEIIELDYVPMVNPNLYNRSVCKNTPVDLCPSGNLPKDYTLTWSNSPNIISKRDSCVTVSVNSNSTFKATMSSTLGCQQSYTVAVNIQQIDNSVSKNGSVLSANASGTYRWLNCNNNYSVIAGQTNNTFTPTAIGSYAVEIKQNGCTDTSNCLFVSCIPMNLTISQSGSNLLSSNELTASSYQWLDCNNGYTPIDGEISRKYTPVTDGSYAVKLTKDTCENISNCFNFALSNTCYTYYTTEYDTSANSFYLTLDDITVQLASSYHWDFGDGTTSLQKTPTHVYTVDGIYNVCLTVDNVFGEKCYYCRGIGKDSAGNIYRTTGFSINVLANNVTEIANLNDTDKSYSIFPNPTNGKTEIEFSENVKNISINIYNVLGKKIHEETKLSGKHFVFDIADYCAGIYIVEISQGQKISRTRLIKQ